MTESGQEHSASTPADRVGDGMTMPMKTWELINPSDKVTFEAPSLEVAAFCAVLLSPHYGVRCVENESESFFEFMGAVHVFESRWGKAADFLVSHETEIADCLDSFAYLSAGERTRYKRAIELIDDPEKRQRFRDEHEERARSSISAICKRAWKYAVSIREAALKRQKEEAATKPQ